MVLATLVVRDDLTHRIHGDRRVIDLTEPMLAFPGPRMVHFRHDPEGWARALQHNVCSPYLYAVVVRDSAQEHTTGRVVPRRRTLGLDRLGTITFA